MALTIGDVKATAEQHRRLQRALNASRTDWHQLQRALQAGQRAASGRPRPADQDWSRPELLPRLVEVIW